MIPDFCKEIDDIKDPELLFSIGTLITKADEYQLMVNSFIKAGAPMNQCEFMYIDNRTNKYEAFGGLNKIIHKSRGKYIILCHQDIELIDPFKKLLEAIQQIELIDKNWAVLGNAGNRNIHEFFSNITHPNNELMKHGMLPARVNTLDENFLVLKRDSLLGFSNDLKGFHFYATDLCLQSSIRGYSNWVIDYNLLHKSTGKIDASFAKIKRDLIKKYTLKLRPRFLRTTITHLFLSSNYPLNIIMNSLVGLFIKKVIFKLFKERAY